MAQYYIVSDELYHHGVLGMKWGVRRYQNADGSLTAAGQKRYNYRKQLADGSRKIAKDQISKSKSSANALKDVEKYKYNSETFRRAFGTDVDSDFTKMGYSSKKEALDLLKKDLRDDRQYYKDQAAKLEKAAAHLENAPITERTLVDDIARGKKVANAAGGLLFASVSALALPAYKTGIVNGKGLAKIILSSAIGSVALTSELESKLVDRAYHKYGIGTSFYEDARR